MLDSRRRWVLLFFILLLASIAGWAVWGWRLGHEYDRRIAALAAAGYPTTPADLVPKADVPGNGWSLLEEAADIWDATCERKDLYWHASSIWWEDTERDAWVDAWPAFAPALDLARRAAGSKILVAPPFLPGDSATAAKVTVSVQNLLDAYATLRPAERGDAIGLCLEIAARIRPHDAFTAGGAYRITEVALRRARRAVEDGWSPSAEESRRLRAALRDQDKPWPELRRGDELVQAHWILTEFQAGRDPFAKARSTMRKLRDVLEDDEPTVIERINDRLDGPIGGFPSGFYRRWIARPLLYRFALRQLEPIEIRLKSEGPSPVATAFERLHKEHLALTRLAEFALAVLGNGGTDGLEVPVDPHTGEPFVVEKTKAGLVLSSPAHEPDEDDPEGEYHDCLRWVVALPR